MSTKGTYSHVTIAMEESKFKQTCLTVIMETFLGKTLVRLQPVIAYKNHTHSKTPCIFSEVGEILHCCCQQMKL